MLAWTKGCQVTDMSRRQAKKQDYLEQLAGAADVRALRAEILTAIGNQCPVCKVTKKGKLIACFVFAREQADPRGIAAEHPQTAEHLMPAGGEAVQPVTILRMIRRVVLAEYEQKVTSLEYDQEVLAEAGLMLPACRAKALIWGCNCVTEKKVNIGGRSVSGYVLGIMLGILMGVALHSAAIGLCFGVALSASFGLMFSTKPKEE